LRSSLIFAAALAAFLAALLAGSATALDRTGDPAKWLTFWTPMMTVLTHDRCYNCHTLTNPRIGKDHGGGELDFPDQFACIGCHTANTKVVEGRCELFGNTGEGTVSPRDGPTKQNAPCMTEGQNMIRVPTGPVWNRLGPPFSMDASEMCEMVKMNRTPEQLVEHVQTDALIAFAFEGNKAIDLQSPQSPVDVEPPPLTKPEFVDLLTRWITEAAMACSTDGTVVLADKTTIDMTLSPLGGASVRKSVDATIDIKNGVATSKLRYTEGSTSAVTAPTRRCKAKESAQVQSTAEGSPDTRYQIDIRPGGMYRMRFFLGSIEAQTGYTEQPDLCRPLRKRSGELPTEPTAEQEFSVEGQAQLSPTESGVWILKGSTPVANNGFAVAGVTSRGERTVTWDIVIR
jgi:hypothetical protein